MTAPLQISSALLNSRLFKTCPTNPELVAGYLDGAIATRGPSVRPLNALRHRGPKLTRPAPQRSPDRERSIHRRRKLAATMPMPPAMASHLTTSQTAYARILADEVRSKGRCELALDEIAARGGMCRKTAQRAQERLVELGWITVEHRRQTRGYKHLPNLVRIVFREWVTWIRMGPKPRVKTGHSCPTTENQSYLTVTVQPSGKVAGLREKELGRRWGNSPPTEDVRHAG